jgi:hypothetical protein
MIALFRTLEPGEKFLGEMDRSSSGCRNQIGPFISRRYKESHAWIARLEIEARRRGWDEPTHRRIGSDEKPGLRGREAGGRRGGQREMAINYRTHFAYRIDAWDAEGENVTEHLAGVEDLQVAKATYLAACQRWPGTPITLRQGTRVIEDSRQTRLV